MGIRVHKVAGYGVTDFKAPQRWGRLLSKAHSTTLDEFVEFCQSREKDIQSLYAKIGCPERAKVGVRGDLLYAQQMMKLGKRRNAAIGAGERTVYSLIGYEDEGELGFPNVLVLIPASEVYEWHRGDDPLDFFEESLRFEQRPHVEELNMGLFPYTQGKPPPTVLGLLLWLEMSHLAPRLRELLYVYWC